ncbi:MAG TPA: archaellin/type IV pilin N-terminal domain-containing protein [Thermoplasmata archaeon]|nr:archaellin/type IV pilin N-terminal domain-containing protein [Thermoplasmata archaeon]
MAKRWLVLKRDEEGVSPVIATILMVAITVVLAAVLYVMVTNLIIVDGNKPQVTLTRLGCEPGSCKASVSGAVPADVRLDLFKVTVLVDGDPVGTPQVIVAGSDLAFGNLTFRYTDLGGEGRMTGGDSFRLSGTSAGFVYVVSFLWQDGSEVAHQEFSV